MSVVLSESVLIELQEILGEDYQLFLQTFCEDTTNRLAKMHAALVNNDVSILKQESHSLKGSSSNLGAHCLFNACHDLEEYSKREDLAQLGDLVDAVQFQANQVIGLLHKTG